MLLYSSFKPQVAGVSSLSAGTDTAVNTSTGAVSVWNTSTFQSITDRGFTTTNRINVANTESSVDPYTGALTVAGGAGIAGDLWIEGTVNASTINGIATTSTNITGGEAGYIPIQISSGVTSFIVAGLENQLLQSQGSTATFVNTSSLHIGYSSNIAKGTSGQIVYQISTSTTGFAGPGMIGQLLASGGTGTPTFIQSGGYGQLLMSKGSGFNPVYQNTLTISESSVLINGIVSSTSTLTGALVVSGGVGIGENLNAGGNVEIAGNLSISGIFSGTTGAYIKSSSLDPLNSSTFTLESTVPVGYSAFTIKNSGALGRSYTIDLGGNNRALTDGSSINEGNLIFKDDISNEYRLVITKTGNMLVNTSTNNGSTLQVNGSLTVSGPAAVGDVSTFTGTATFLNSVVIQTTLQETRITLVNTTGTTEVDSFESNVYRSCKSLVQVQDGDDFHITEIVLLHDNGGQVYKSEYGIISTGGERGMFTADLQLDGIVRLYFTAENASNKKVSIVKTAIAV